MEYLITLNSRSIPPLGLTSPNIVIKLFLFISPYVYRPTIATNYLGLRGGINYSRWIRAEAAVRLVGR